MKKSLVISHYNENLDWVKSLDPEIKIYLYTKGNFGSLPSFLKGKNNIYIESLENIGNEQHTYYYHLVKNYNNLEDLVYFIQANPHDHSRNFMEKINSNFIGGISDFNFITSLYGDPGDCYYKHINHKYFEIDYTEVKDKIFIDPWNNTEAISNINFIFNHLPELKTGGKNWTFNANGLYSSTRDRILSFSKSFYLRCLECFYTSEETIKMQAFAFERISPMIFLDYEI
jgi:hypothetical protein